IARIARMTPSVVDMIPIMFDEWLVEVGSINYSFGRGIGEWSFVLIPGKAVIALGIAALGATNLVLLRSAWKACGIFARLGSSVATGAGALVAGAAATTITWVVCCAAPTWVVGLAVMGVGVTTALALQPFGGSLLLLGLSTLVTSAILLLRQLSGRRSRDAAIRCCSRPLHGRRRDTDAREIITRRCGGPCSGPPCAPSPAGRDCGRVEIWDVSVRFRSGGKTIHALENTSVDISPGSFACLLGPSGCGKSTLLNTVAGYVRPTTGWVRVDGDQVVRPGPDRGMVFQQ